MRTTLALPPLLIALLLAGCGSSSGDSAEDFKGDQRAVAVAVEDLEEAGRDDEGDKICGELLAQSLLKRLGQAGTNCKTAVNEALDDADSFDLEVDRIRITGRTATVNVTSGNGDQEKKDTLLLEREGPRWKIASLGAR